MMGIQWAGLALDRIPELRLEATRERLGGWSESRESRWTLPDRSGPGLPAMGFALLAVYLCWGSTYLAIKVAISGLPPFLMASSRFVIAGGILYLADRIWHAGSPRPTRAQWRAALVVGAALLLLGNGGVVWAEQRLPSGVAALLIATVPPWTTLSTWLRGSRPSSRALIGTLAGFLGVAVLLDPLHAGRPDVLASAVVLGAAISWAVGSIYSGAAGLPNRWQLASAMQMLAGGGLLGVAGLASGEASRLTLARPSPLVLAAVAYLIVFGSLIGFSAYNWLLRSARPSVVSTYAFVNPVVAVGLGAVLLGESLTPRTAVAGVIIAIALALIMSRQIASAGRQPTPTQATSPRIDRSPQPSAEAV